MNELQQIIRAFEKDEEVCRKLFEESKDAFGRSWYLSRASAFSTVVGVLKDFEAKHLMLVRPAEKAQESMDKEK